jgi:membrane protein implicated in regulation of membrane protease activity
MWEVWWVWVAAGMLLAILEVVAPGYIFVGFALGAVATGLILLAGVWPAGWMDGNLPRHLIVFAVLSVAAWLGLRQLLGVRRGQVKTFDRDINED